MTVSISTETIQTGSPADAAALLAAAGDPTRLRILRQLATAGETCVCDMDTPGLAPNLLSYHLKVLRDARLVTTRRDGRRIEYRLAPDALPRLHGALPGETTPR